MTGTAIQAHITRTNGVGVAERSEGKNTVFEFSVNSEKYCDQILDRHMFLCNLITTVRN